MWARRRSPSGRLAFPRRVRRTPGPRSGWRRARRNLVHVPFSLYPWSLLDAPAVLPPRILVVGTRQAERDLPRAAPLQHDREHAVPANLSIRGCRERDHFVRVAAREREVEPFR